MSSKILVDELAGKTATGNITVTSEGGSATMQLQQGLAKAFISFDGVGTVSTDTSFNISTLTDNAAADYSITYTNNMDTSNHPITGSVVGSGEINYYSFITSAGVAQTTSVDRVASVHNNGSSNNDQDPVHLVTHGDLA